MRLPAAVETHKTRAIGYKLRDGGVRILEMALAGKPLLAGSVDAAAAGAGGAAGRPLVLNLSGPVHVSSREVRGAGGSVLY
jgi:hypothetical protein